MAVFSNLPGVRPTIEDGNQLITGLDAIKFVGAFFAIVLIYLVYLYRKSKRQDK